ncbi:DUF4165 domain-containing protein [Burkholderia sp. MBR-1]|uniref:DUF4165 domain-containing protein n=1 Tax=Burkholderia sp. MBR-1 TaxID=2732364 RepID=UPI0015EFBDB8|nr:DUF4165 domain-containing protein [Burkholderia sp. MBR-1]QMI49788.1 DUF4165 domain-containing protein [Burkholderia sp. MBR-1]
MKMITRLLPSALNRRARAGLASVNPAFRSVLGAILLVVLGLVGTPAHADLLQYSFSDSTGSVRTLQPNDQFANPVGTITFALSGGLSRIVRVSLTSQDGRNTLNSATSAALGPNDLISVGGQSYYGATLALKAPAEGQYLIKADLLSASGSVLSTSSYPLWIDTTAPVVGSFFGTGNGMCYAATCASLKDNDFIGHGSEPTALGVNGVTDSGTGIASATFSSFASDGSLYKTTSASYAPATGAVSIANVTSNLPTVDGPITIQFVVTDKAGNSTTVRKPLKWNAIGVPAGSWSIAAVKNPAVQTNFLPGSPFTGFEAYQSGMTVHTNPVTFVIRILKSQWIANNQYGFYLCCTNVANPKTADYEDGTYSYKIITLPYNTAGNSGNYVIFYDGTSPGVSAFGYNVVLASDVPPSPAWAGTMEVYYDDIGWSSGNRIVNQAVTWSQVRFYVAARTYAQQVTVAPGVVCSIPVGATSCVSAVSGSLDTTAGTSKASQPVYYATQTGGVLQTSGNQNFLIVVDKGAPTIESFSYDAQGGTVVVSGHKPTQGNSYGFCQLKTGTISVVAGGVTKSFSGTFVLGGQGAYTLTTKLGALPQGNAQLIAQISDSAGNVTTQTLGTYTIDTVPPTISTSIGSGASIQSIDDVVVGVTDNLDPAPKLTTANLQGGLAGVNVNLAFNVDAQGKYHLQYPALASTLNLTTGQNTPYILTLGASDASGNIGTTTVSFNFSPPQVVLTNLQGVNANVPAIAPPGTPVTDTVQSPPITLGDGSILSGVYPVQATLRADAPGPISIGGVTLQPGQTQTISNYDFGAAGGRLSFPVSARAAGTSGAATLYLSTSAPNAPLGVATVTVWDPSTELARCAPAITLSNVGGGLDGEPLTAQANWSMTAAQSNGSCAPFLAWLAARAPGATLLDVAVGLNDSKGAAAATLTPSQPISSFTGQLIATGSAVLPAGSYTVRLVATWAVPVLEAFGLSSAAPVNAVQTYTLACPAPTLLGAQPQPGTRGAGVLALVHVYQCNGPVMGTLALTGIPAPLAGRVLDDSTYNRGVPLNRIIAYAFDLTGVQLADGAYQGNFTFAASTGGSATSQQPIRIETATAIPLAMPMYNGADLAGQSVPSFGKIFTAPILPPAYSVVAPTPTGNH